MRKMVARMVSAAGTFWHIYEYRGTGKPAGQKYSRNG